MGKKSSGEEGKGIGKKRRERKGKIEGCKGKGTGKEGKREERKGNGRRREDKNFKTGKGK